MNLLTMCVSKTSVILYVLLMLTEITSSAADTSCRNASFNLGNSKIALNPAIFLMDDGLEIVEYFFEITPCSKRTIRITDVPTATNFIVLQIHSYLYELNLSSLSSKKNDSVQGKNIGLVNYVDRTNPTDVYSYILENQNIFPVSVLIAAVFYKYNVPIPGGCNMEFETETAPFLKLSYTLSLIQVDAQPARMQELGSIKNNQCALDNIDYDVYQLYMTRDDYSEEAYFNSIRKMLTVKRIKENGRKITKPLHNPKLRRTFSIYFGTGTVYAMIASVGDLESAAYVPIQTYACTPEYSLGICPIPLFSSMLPRILLGIVGIFLCFFGNKYSNCEMTAMFALFITLITFVLIMDTEDNFPTNEGIPKSATISLIFGLIIGAVLVYLCQNCDIGIKVISSLVDGIMFGILLASIIFYTPISDASMFSDSQQYWILFVIIILVGALLVLYFDKVSDRLTPSLVGSYAIILFLEFFIHSNLKYVILNPLMHATVEGFETAVTSPPYQAFDFIMMAVWFVLFVLGMTNRQPNRNFLSEKSTSVTPTYGTFSESDNGSVFCNEGP